MNLITWGEEQHHAECADNGVATDYIKYIEAQDKPIVAWCHYRYAGGTCLSAELVGYVNGKRVYEKQFHKSRYLHPHSYKLHLVTQYIDDRYAGVA